MAHACKAGAASIEMDINETSDGVLVSSHDATPGSGSWLSEVTFDDLARQPGGDWESRRLEEVLPAVLSWGAMAYFDLKSVTPAGLAKIEGMWPEEVAAGRITFASARGDVVAWLGQQIPQAATSFLYYDRLLDLKSLKAFMAPTFVHPCFDHLRDPFRSVDVEYVARARSYGFGLVSWNENDPARVAHLAELGFDYICTDEPELGIEAIGSTAIDGTRTP